LNGPPPVPAPPVTSAPEAVPSDAVAEETGDLAALWRWFGESQCRGYSALYERIAEVVAGDDETLALVQEAPPAAHLPPMLFGAVHYLLLQGLEHPLADVYSGRTDADPAPLFIDVCRSRRADVARLLATRHVQTNECGRSAVIGPGLTWLARRFGGPLALVDVGASAGLNLVCDRYRLDYGPHGATGPPSSPVVVRCDVVGGEPPVAPTLPELAARVGVDRSPVELGDPDDARWLLACVWPDTGRLERTAAAIRLAQADPPRLVAGDAVATVARVVAALPAGTSAVVVTTWAFAYLSVDERAEFVGELAEVSRRRRVAWLSAEGPGTVELLAQQATPDPPVPERLVPAEPDVLGLVTFDDGATDAQVLAFVHPHGLWMDWRAPPVDRLGAAGSTN
jgi:hypothetical protein